MIKFFYENNFSLAEEAVYTKWIADAISNEGFSFSEINYIFCNDAYLLDINKQFLNHDTYTDIISFDYSVGKILQGDIYISTERVAENAKIFNVSFKDELLRVLIHGVLHYCGYKDKTESDKTLMRSKEDLYISKFLSN